MDKFWRENHICAKNVLWTTSIDLLIIIMCACMWICTSVCMNKVMAKVWNLNSACCRSKLRLYFKLLTVMCNKLFLYNVQKHLMSGPRYGTSAKLKTQHVLGRWGLLLQAFRQDIEWIINSIAGKFSFKAILDYSICIHVKSCSEMWNRK